jgi:hypothetical protein
MSRIFISYRRADSAMAAGRLYDHLSSHFGENLVFMDIDTIEPGEDFVEVIENAVTASSAVVVVIGPDWLTIMDATGQRRLDNPNDFVRLEIAAALERNIRVIPVLVDGATMPDADNLPEPLVKLTRRNALVVSNERFRYDVGKLIETLDKVAEVSPSKPEPKPTTPTEKIGPKREDSLHSVISTNRAIWGPVVLTAIIWAIGGAIGSVVGAIVTGYNQNGIVAVIPTGVVVGLAAGVGIRLALNRFAPAGGWKPLLGVVAALAIVGLIMSFVFLGSDPNNQTILFVGIPILALWGGGIMLWQFSRTT